MKKYYLFVLGLFFMLIISGCKSYKTVTYNVNSDDKVTITLDTTNGYDITPNIPFNVTKDTKVICKGQFLNVDSYDTLMNDITSDTKADVLDKGTRKDGKYVYYAYDNDYWAYIIKINGQSLAVGLSSENKDNISTCSKLIKIEYN